MVGAVNAPSPVAGVHSSVHAGRTSVTTVPSVRNPVVTVSTSTTTGHSVSVLSGHISTRVASTTSEVSLLSPSITVANPSSFLSTVGMPAVSRSANLYVSSDVSGVSSGMPMSGPPTANVVEHGVPHVPVSPSVTVSSVTPPIRGMGTARRGKAPPVDPYTGEDPEIRFEDWLPTLTQAVTWNHWSEEESLMQLAGYLRGRA